MKKTQGRSGSVWYGCAFGMQEVWGLKLTPDFLPNFFFISFFKQLKLDHNAFENNQNSTDSIPNPDF